MLTFALIAEGPTDQVVLRNILLGYFEHEDSEPAIQDFDPPRPLTERPSGWGHVFKSLERKRHQEALQHNDYLVIHIDTDVQDDPGYGVPRRVAGKELSVPERVKAVIEKLKAFIDPAYYQANMQRILFAVSVDSIECWLLPLLYENKKKAKKTTGCLDAANRALGKANQKRLSAGKETIDAYEYVSRPFTKRNVLMENRDKNPSLDLFIQQLDELPKG